MQLSEEQLAHFVDALVSDKQYLLPEEALEHAEKCL